MYKFFRNIGLILIVITSFIYTERLTNVVKEYDDIMVDIKENKSLFETKPIEAKIVKNTIIPGLNGRVIDIDKSYKKMREYGKYNEDLFVYKKISPKDKLNDNIDKYVIKGNKKNKVAIILTNLNDIDSILKYNQKFSFYITNSWYEENKEKAITLVDEGYTLLSNDNKYIKKILGQKNGYCYVEDYNKDILKKCKKNDDYTIIPSIIIKDNSLINLEKSIDSGSIITIKIKNPENAIKYIVNKGYEIVSLEELLDEDI